MKPFIIPIFIPNHGCPNKCIYCDQNISVGQQTLPTSNEIRKTIESHLKSASIHSKSLKLAQVAFYGGTFTGLAPAAQKNYLKTVTPYINNKTIHSVRISTRPDYVDQENIYLLKSLHVKTIELGVQSMENEVLIMSKRGYTAAIVEKSASLIKKNGLELGAQLMPGLPGDNEETIINSAGKVCEIKPDFLRIYPAVVLKNSILHELYLKGEYSPLSLDKAVQICKKMLLLFQSNKIPVIRVGLQPTPAILKEGVIVAGPFHPAFKELVLSNINYDPISGFIKKRRDSKSFIFSVHPTEISAYIGNKKENIRKLKKEFPDIEIKFQAELSVPKGSFKAEN